MRDRAVKDVVGGADEATSLEELDLKLLEDFDQRLGSDWKIIRVTNCLRLKDSTKDRAQQKWLQ
jgi:hypothetical protein